MLKEKSRFVRTVPLHRARCAGRRISRVVTGWVVISAIWIWEDSAANAIVRINGTEVYMEGVSGGANTSDTDSQDAAVGRHMTLVDTQNYFGDMGAFMILDSEPSVARLQHLENWLRNDWIA